MNNAMSGLYQCRLCLKRTSARVNVFAGDFPKMLEIVTSIKVQENDGLPKYSCPNCAQDVKSALMIKRRIIKAHKILIEALKKKRADLLNQKVNAFAENKSNTQQTLNKSIFASPNTSGLIFSNTRRPKISQRPIEFVNVSDTDKSTTTSEEGKQKRENDPRLTYIQRTIMNKVVINSNRTWKCEICNITFKNKSSYTTHCGKHKKTTCEICKITVRSDNFKKHMLLHTSGPTSCEICGRICKNIESLRGHIFYQHKSSANEYVCEECGKHFRIKYKFELHKKKEHTFVRNFKCETCGKSFFTNGNLMTHVNMTHKKLRPHICEFCGTGFSSAYALKTHKRQHTNEKPFKCEFCTESFRQKVSLRSHLKSKHKVEESKEHLCNVCDKGFATTYALSIHARLHMKQKCEICSESFAEKEYLRSHLKDVHNVISEDTQTEELNQENTAEIEDIIKTEIVEIQIKPENQYELINE